MTSILFPATYRRPLLHFPLPRRRCRRRRKGRRCPSRSFFRRRRRRRIPIAIIAHSRQSDEDPPHSHIARIQEAATSINSGRGPFTRCLAVVSLALTAIQPPPFHSLRRTARPFSSDKPIAPPRDEESEEWRRRPTLHLFVYMYAHSIALCVLAARSTPSPGITSCLYEWMAWLPRSPAALSARCSPLRPSPFFSACPCLSRDWISTDGVRRVRPSGRRRLLCMYSLSLLPLRPHGAAPPPAQPAPARSAVTSM